MNSLLYCIVLYEQQRREWLRNVFSGLFHSSRVAPRFVESISSVTLPYRTRRRFFTVLSRSMTSSHESTVISVLPLTKLCNLDIVSHECIFVCVASFGSSCLSAPWTLQWFCYTTQNVQVALRCANEGNQRSHIVQNLFVRACKRVVEDSFFVGRNGTTKPSVSSLNKIDFPSETATKPISVGTDI